MSRFIAFTINDETKNQIDRLARLTGKQDETVMRELVETGLKIYKTSPTKSAKATLDLIEWAEKKNITGKVTDASANHNKYAWEE
jgi:predicted DNA-binding protein